MWGCGDLNPEHLDVGYDIPKILDFSYLQSSALSCTRNNVFLMSQIELQPHLLIQLNRCL